MRPLRRMLGFVGFLAILVAFAPAEIAAQKKKKNKEKDKASFPVAVDADYKAIQRQRDLYGKLVSIDSAHVTLRVEYPRYEANPKFKPTKITNPNVAGYNAQANTQARMWRAYNDIIRHQQSAVRSKNPQEYQRAMQRVAQDMSRLQQEVIRMYQQMYQAPAGGYKMDPNNQPFVIVTDTKDFDLDVQEKAIFRKMILPFEYDDIGNIKVYTLKEKKEMRGDDKTKPGYLARLDEFQPGQEVRLSLTPPKKAPKDKEADKDADKDVKLPQEVLRPTVHMVLMTKDNSSTSTMAGADDKKKKKK